MDHATANLPSRDFAATKAFYAALGFAPIHDDEDWLILRRGAIMLEFFPHPKLKPHQSWFSCCLRLDDLDAFYADCLAAGIPQGTRGAPRLHAPHVVGDMRMGALIDHDGSLLRLIQN